MGKFSKIIRQIGSGGFSVTYEAEHVMLQRRVAIKEFFVKDFCNRDETTSHVSVGTQSKVALVDKLRKKFFDEAVAINKLDHPNIIKVSDVFIDNGTVYYVMDYIDGLSLNEVLKREGKLSEKKALKYILQVADALKYVHSKNRLHLDIKPGNIMIDDKDNAILIDFGASKQYDEESGENTSTLLGKTLGYAPIEQMGNSVQTFTPATDIYALGATLYKLITGITPPEATLLASGEQLQPMGDDISEDVKATIHKSMELNKSKRPQSIDAFVSMLPKRKPQPQYRRDTTEETIVDSSSVQDDSEETIVDTNISKQKPSSSNEEQVINEVNEWANETHKKPEIEDSKKDDDARRRKSFIIPGIIAVVVLLILVFSFFNGQTPKATPIADIDSISTVDSVMDMGDEVAYADSAVAYSEEPQNIYFTNSKGISFKYTGKVVNGKPNGMGTGRYDNGEYNGPYVNGLRSGDNATFNTSDGENTFLGSFRNDEYYKGSLTLKSGEYFIGTFSNGQPYTGTWYNSDHTIYSTIKNGE